MKSNRRINPYIEILRLVGIFLLVLYHIGCMGNSQSSFENFLFFIARKGWIGTDLFLVIAGYFFYQSFSIKYNENILAYWKNPGLRIVPSYFLFLLLYLSIGIHIENFFGNDFIINKGYWLYLFTFTANIPMALGNWSGVALEGLFGISLLVQLLIFFSLMFAIVKKQKNRFTLLLILEIFVIIIRFNPSISNRHWFSYFFTFTRMDGFLAGITLALLRENDQISNLFKNKRSWFLAISIALLLGTAPFSGWWETTHPITSIITFPALALFFTSLLNYILTLPIPQWSLYSGDFVYSIYLAKLPLIYVVKGYLTQNNLNLNKPFVFLTMSFLICLIWGILLFRIHRFRRTISSSIIYQ